MPHKNADDSEELQHLYEIVDKIDYDTFKYGISSGPISKKDGGSSIFDKIKYLIAHVTHFFTQMLHR
jgi:hypothetical protein